MTLPSPTNPSTEYHGAKPEGATGKQGGVFLIQQS